MAWEIDFQLSFGDPSPGRAEQRIVNSSGQPILGRWIWKAVEEAIAMLGRSLPADPSKEPALAVRDAFPEIANQIRETLQSNFLPMLLEIDGEGSLDVRGELPEGGILVLWKSYGLVERSRVFLQLIEQLPMALVDSKEFGELVRLIAAACVISSANAAAISVFFDGSGLDETAADVRWFQRYMELPSGVAMLVDVARVHAQTESTQVRTAGLRQIAKRPRGSGKDVSLEQVAAFFGERQGKQPLKRIVADAAASFGTSKSTINRRLKEAREKNLMS